MLFQFRTTAVNEMTGEEEFQAKKIAIQYLKGRFVVDFLATVPLDYLIVGAASLESGSDFQFIQILKITRLFRFTKVISFLNVTEDVKLSLKLLKLIFYLLVYLHLQACAWFYYTKQDRSWLPLTDLIKNKDDFYDHGFSFTYCFSVWHSVSILDGADMVPATGQQAILVSFLVIVSEFIHAHILGTIGVVL